MTGMTVTVRNSAAPHVMEGGERNSKAHNETKSDPTAMIMPNQNRTFPNRAAMDFTPVIYCLPNSFFQPGESSIVHL
jgi:hypothetical protein